MNTSDFSIQIIFFVLFGVLAAAGAYFGHLQHKKRLAELQAWCDARGLEFWPGKKQCPWPNAIFQKGHSRWRRLLCKATLRDTIAGMEADHTVELFEYHYAITTGSGKNRSTQHYYFACAHVNVGPDLGFVKVRDENWGDRLAEKLGKDDIDFEDPEFSKMFYVTSKDRQRCSELFHTRMMDYMKGWSGQNIEAAGPLLLVYKRGKGSIASYEQLLNFATGFMKHLPRTMINRWRAEQGLPPVAEAGAAGIHMQRAREQAQVQTEPGEKNAEPSQEQDGGTLPGFPDWKPGG